MNTSIKQIILFLFTLVFTGCDFTEECVYYGTMKGTMDWSGVGREVPVPSEKEMNIVIQPLTGLGIGRMAAVPEELILDRGVFQKELWIGSYDVMVYNSTVLTLVNPTSMQAALTMSTVTKQGKTFLEKELSPVFAFGNEEMAITHEDTAQLVIKPTLFVWELQFNIQVKNVINTKILRVDGVLDGVSTGKHLLGQNVTDGYASLNFATRQIEGAENLYSGSFYLLGVHSEEENNLIIKLSFADGHELFTTVNLSGRLKKFTGDKAVISIDVETGELTTTSEIKDWEEVDWGTLSNNHSL